MAEARPETICAIGNNSFVNQGIKPEGTTYETGRVTEGKWGERDKKWGALRSMDEDFLELVTA